MQYQKIQPSEILQPYISKFFILENEQTLKIPLEIKSAATAAMALVFNYGTPHKIYNDHYNGAKLPNIIFSGISTAPYTLRYTDKLAMFGIIFNGTAFLDLFDFPPIQSWLNHRIDAEYYIKTDARNVNDQLANAINNHERVALIEKWLLQRLMHRHQEKSIIDTTVNIINEHKGMIRLDDLTEKIGYSSRQLRRKFKERVGISPKLYARLKRFNYVNLCLTNNPELSWFSFIDDNAFYDQSHLIKDYKAFSGSIPSRFLESRTKIHEKLMKKPVSA